MSVASRLKRIRLLLALSGLVGVFLLSSVLFSGSTSLNSTHRPAQMEGGSKQSVLSDRTAANDHGGGASTDRHPKPLSQRTQCPIPVGNAVAASPSDALYLLAEAEGQGPSEQRHQQQQQRVFVAASMKQIHHGVYRVEAPLDGCHASSSSSSPSSTTQLRFALKTECRPPQKWHGQQGWGEVAAYTLMQLLEQQHQQQQPAHPSSDAEGSGGGDGFTFQNTVPFAMGGVVLVTQAQLASIVHRDRCGVMNSTDLAALAATHPSVYQELLNKQKHSSNRNAHDASAGEREAVPPSGGLVPLIGVLLTWMPRHNDNALPPKSWHQHFVLPQPLSPSSEKVIQKAVEGKPLAGADRPLVLQAADIMLLDYVLGNEDREDKNWFRYPLPPSGAGTGGSSTISAASDRFIMMDNGWTFSGRAYKESICGLYRPLLQCPPLLRYLSGSATCNKRSHKNNKPVTGAVIGLCRVHKETLDVLRRTLKQWAVVARRWRERVRADVLIAFLLEAYSPATNAVYNAPFARNTGKECAASVDHNSDPLEQLLFGLRLRLQAAVEAMESCIAAHGLSYVHMTEQG